MRLFYGCFTDSRDESEDFYVEKIQNGSERVSKMTNMEPKGSQSEPSNFQKHQLRNRVEQIQVLKDSQDAFWKAFLFKSINKSHQKSYQKRSPQNMEFDAEGEPKWYQNRCQNSSTINAKTGNKKIIEININHVSLNGNIIKIHCKSKCL